MKKATKKLFRRYHSLPRFAQRLLMVVLVFTTVFTSGGVLYLFGPFQQHAEAAWYDDNWQYRKAVNITAHTAAENNVYAIIPTTLDTATLISGGKMKSDCSDLRFTDQSGNLLTYFITASPGCNNASTVVHVFFSTFPAGPQTIYYYYGNPSASNVIATADFATQASNYTVGTTNSEETAPSPAAYWKFDEGQGTSANDSSENTNTGTLAGTTKPTWQTPDQCVSGKCLYFDGSTSNITVANTIRNIQTISMWVNPASITSAALIDLDGGTHKITVSSGTISATGFTSPTIYVNGVVSSTLTANTWNYVTVTTGTSFNSSSSLTIGKSSATYLQGYLDEVKIYAFAKSVAQIQADFSSRGSILGVSAQGTLQNQNLSNGLVGYWKMNESSWSGTASEVVDSSGAGNNGTFNGAKNGDANTTNVTATSGTANSISKSTASWTVNGFTNFSVTIISGTGCLVNNTEVQKRIITSNTATKLTVSPNWTINPTSSCHFTISDMGAGKFGNGGTLNGVNNYVGVSNTISGVQSIGFWVNPTSVSSGGLIQLTASAYITLSSGTISTSGLTSATIYVNGAMSSTLSASSWQYVTVTATAGISSNAVQFGEANSIFTNGIIDEVRMYNRVLAAAEIQQLYNFAQGPIAAYNFEEGSGTTVNDISGNANTGTWNGSGASHWKNGKFSKAGNFNGTDDYVNAGSATAIDNIKPISVGAWIYPTSMGGTNGGMIVSKATGSLAGNLPSHGWALMLATDVANEVKFAWDFTGSHLEVFSAANTITLNQWQYVEVTWDGTIGSGSSSHVHIYLNGKEVTYGSGGLNDSAGEITDDSSYNLCIGKACGDNNASFQGQIDQVTLYNYTRTPAQTVQDMNLGHPAGGSPAGSEIGYWKMDEGYGTTINNSGSSGTSVSGTLSGSTTPSWTQSGKYNQALSFNGTTAYVTLGNPSALQFTSDLTISAWVNLTTNNAIHDIVAKEGNAALGYRLFTDASGKLNMEVSSNGSSATGVTGNTTLATGTWYHIVGVYSPGNSLTVYVNGAQDKKNTSSIPASVNNTSANAEIGSDTTGASNARTHYMSGTIDEVKIYAAALTSSDILIDYNRGQSIVLGTLSDNSSYGQQAANQQYCIPGDASSCASPVGEWNFEENTGSTVNDTSGNNKTGTWNGTLGKQWAPGEYGAGGNFNGSDNYVSVSATISGIKTVGFWVYPSSTTQYFVDLDGGTHYISASSGTVSATGFTSPTIYVNGVSATTITANTWNHIEVTTGTAISGSAITIGKANGSNYLNGKTDQVRVYNYARSAAQVAYDYNRGGPVGWWKMDECQGTNINDSSGNGNTGTLTIGGSGSQTAVGTCSTPTDGTGAWYNGRTGKYNSSMNFDGTDDYISIANNSILAPTSALAISAWVKTTSSGAMAIFSHYNSGSPYTGYGLAIGNFGSCSAGTLTFWSSGQGTWQCGGSTTVNDGNWHHIVATYDGTNLTFYIDGKNNNTSALTAPGASSNSEFIGKNGDSTGFFSGQIDDARIYNYALTASQIKVLYNQGAAVRYGPATGAP